MAKKPTAGGEAREKKPEAAKTDPKRNRKMTQEERMAGLRFIKAAYAEALRYADMTEEEVEEEYRLAGKLHKYDPDTEWQKRYARVARIYPPPNFMAPNLAEYMAYLEEDEHDYAIGLTGCVGILEEDDTIVSQV